MPRPPKGYISRTCKGKKTNGDPCKRWAQHHNDYCATCNQKRGHSAIFKPGPANPNYRHGVYAKVVPTKLLKAYQDGLDDPDLLSGKDEVAVLRARLTQVIERTETGESDATWDRLAAAKYEFELNVSQPDPTAQAKAQKALSDIMSLIDTGHSQRLAWADVERLTALLDKLKMSERKRLMEMKAFVTITEAIAMLQTMTWTLKEIVPKEVEDQGAQQRILEGMAKAVERMLTMGALTGDKDAA